MIEVEEQAAQDGLVPEPTGNDAFVLEPLAKVQRGRLRVQLAQHQRQMRTKDLRRGLAVDGVNARGAQVVRSFVQNRVHEIRRGIFLATRRSRSRRRHSRLARVAAPGCRDP